MMHHVAMPARHILSALRVDASSISRLDGEAIVLIPHFAMVDVNVSPRDIKTLDFDPALAEFG